MYSARTNQEPPTKAETAKTNKYIRDTISQIEDMKKKKWQLKLLVTPRRMTAKLGEFSAAIYQHGHCIEQQDNLSRLPSELVHIVLKLLENPDKVALALTCKYYMGVIESVRKIPVKRPTITKPMRLAVLIRLHAWMPPGLKLCYSCVKFIPSIENGPWYGDVDIQKKKLANKKAVDYGPRCNSCDKRGRIESAKAGANAQRLKKLIREM